MEIKIDIEALRKRKLFIATPMYGGQCNGMYTRSLCDLTSLCVKYGIEIRSYFLFNESLITRARNYCVDEFLRSDAEHLLFIDSDIGFNPQDVIAMMALQTPESNYDVIAGPYPKKCITWEKIVQAINKGVAAENPNVLEDFVGDFVFNPAMEPGETSKTIQLDQPAEVLEAGTGFMMIRRKTFENYLKSYPEIQYRPDHVRTEAFDGSREIGMYFQAEVDKYNPEKDYEEMLRRIQNGGTVTPDEAALAIKSTRDKIQASSKRYLSEDYLFCQNVRKMGGKVWLCPWMHLQHAGTYVFAGRLTALAAVGASATADAELIKKQRDAGRNKAPHPAIAMPKPVKPVAPSSELLKKFKTVTK